MYASKVRVIKIFDMRNPEIEFTETFGPDELFHGCHVYVVGEINTLYRFNGSFDDVCNTVFKYYLSIIPVYYYETRSVFHALNGIMHGLDRKWYANGQKEYKYTRKDNNISVRKTWYENGQLKDRFWYEDEKLTVKEGWYDNGNRKYWIGYKNDIRDGPYKEWHDNNKLKYLLEYKEGKLDGDCLSWYINGMLRENCIYSSGTRVRVLDSRYITGEKRPPEGYVRDMFKDLN